MTTRTKWLTAGLLAAVLATAVPPVATAQAPGGQDRGGPKTPRADPPRGPAAAGPPARAWEYKVTGGGLLGRTPVTEDALNQLGEQGWELCAAGDQGVLIFKRPKAGAVGGFGGGFMGAGGGFFPGRPVGGPDAVPPPRPAAGGSGPAERPGEVHVFALRNANAPDLATLLKEVFARPSGREGRGEPQRSSAVVTADPRTNSVVVVASGETLEAIKALVERLDGPDGGPGPRKK